MYHTNSTGSTYALLHAHFMNIHKKRWKVKTPKWRIYFLPQSIKVN